MKKLILSVFVLLTAQAYAQEAVTPDDLAFADEVLETPTLNINGKVQEEKKEEIPVQKIVVKKPLTASQKIQLYRTKLEERNRMMVQKKIEEIRLRQELALMKQLEAQMNKTLKAIDSVE